MTDDERAEEIRATVTTYQRPWPVAWSMDEAADDVEWLLAQRDRWMGIAKSANTAAAALLAERDALLAKVAQHHDLRDYRLLDGSKPMCSACGEDWVSPRWRCDVWRAPDTCFTTQSAKPCAQCSALAEPARCTQQSPRAALSEPQCTKLLGHEGAHLFTSHDGRTPLEMMPK